MPQLACGVAYLIFGLILQNPPKNALPIFMIVIAAVTMVTALFGMLSSCVPRFSCVFCYCIWGSVITCVQLVIVLICM